MVLSSTGNIFSASIVKLGIGSLPQRILKLYTDEVPELLDEKGLCNYLKFYPAGASFQNIHHMKQMIESDEFKKYDYGTDAKNLKMYGQIEPPMYDIEKVKDFDIIMVFGKTDKLSV